MTPVARGGVLRFGAALVLVLVAASSATEGRAISAVQKVIQMLGDMTVKAKKERNEEQVAFARFTTWCSSSTANLQSDIQKGAGEIESMTASVGQLASDIKEHGSRLAKLQVDQTNFEAEAKAQTAQRQKDHAAFEEQEKDFAESVDAIERALVILARKSHDHPGDAAAALLQSGTGLKLPEQARSLVTGFLGMMDGDGDEPDHLAYSPPSANAYEFQSGGITEMLKKLADDFRSKLSDCQKEEMNSKHASDMIVMDLKDSAENAMRETQELTMLKQDKAAKKAVDSKQLKGAIAVKADNEKQLEEVATECREKKFSFEEKQQLRAEEIEAMGKAVEILNSPEVMGSAEKHLALAQGSMHSALVQLIGGETSPRLHIRLFDFLAAEGTRLHSDRLSMLAQKSMTDPFEKVRAMIENLIKRLNEEAHEDAKHEAFCSKELGESKITRDRLTSTVDSLTAAIEDAKSTILGLTEETAQLSKEIADLDQATAEATTLRSSEKATNEETIVDAVAAQKAVAAATAVLKDFYAKASTATALVQAPAPREWGLKTGVRMGSDEWSSLANPNFEGKVDTGHKEGMQTFGDVEQGQQDEAQNGVLGLLEVISSDFARLEAETSAQESSAAQTYSRFMAESKQSKAVKARKVEMNASDKLSTEAKLQSNTADLKATQDQLLAANRYYDSLKPQCVDSGMKWDERVAARKDEIQSLKEALNILDGADIA